MPRTIPVLPSFSITPFIRTLMPRTVLRAHLPIPTQRTLTLVVLTPLRPPRPPLQTRNLNTRMRHTSSPAILSLLLTPLNLAAMRIAERRHCAAAPEVAEAHARVSLAPAMTLAETLLVAGLAAAVDEGRAVGFLAGVFRAERRVGAAAGAVLDGAAVVGAVLEVFAGRCAEAFFLTLFHDT